ncbi:MAG: phosphonate metabolism transcriptional regulator PhnF [Polaromonas sp.]|nr:phosphonate metabolism transcriptional regulator PhnF [Polaromonas sp.]
MTVSQALSHIEPDARFAPTHANHPPRDSFWVRIATELADAIAQGQYTPGQRLPSEHALAQQFGVNRHTVRRSLASLCSQGLLRATQGSGTYVEDFAVELVLSSRTRHRQNLALSGMKGKLQVLESQTVPASSVVALKLCVPEDSPLLWLRVLADVEAQPLSLSERHFPLQRFPDLESVLRSTGSLTQAFAAHGVHDYTRRESRVTADMPDTALAAHLHMPTTRPVLRVDSLNVDAMGSPIEWARAWFPADRVALNVDHTKEQP